MKRWKTMTLALALILAMGMLAASLWVSAQGAPIMYEEKLLQGDPAAFEGLTVQQNYGLFAQFGVAPLRWLARYHPGQDGAADTTWHYAAFNEYEQPESEEPPLHLFVGSELAEGQTIYSDRYFSEEDQAALHRLCDAMRKRMPQDASSWTETIRAADWLERFPIMVTHGNDDVLSNLLDPEHIAALQRWFTIPVPDDLMLDVTVSWTGDYTYLRTFLSGNYAHIPRFENHAVQYGEDVLFTVDLMTDDGTVLDASKIPGGTGVYRLTAEEPFIETLAPFPAAARVHALELLPDGERLAIISELGGTASLTILSAETGETLQTLPLPAEPGAASWVVIRQDDLLLLRTSSMQLMLLAPEADGSYTVAQQADGTSIRYFGGGSVTYAYDGDRLAIVTPTGEGTGGLDLEISVYDKTGVRSTMLCTCSLTSENAHGAQPVFAGHPDRLQVSFETGV